MAEAAETEWFPHLLSSATRHPSFSGRFCAALEAHEEGHVELVVQQLSGLDERLVGQSVGAAQRVWKQALAAVEAASETYDRETDHGRKRGTIIDVSVGAL